MVPDWVRAHLRLKEAILKRTAIMIAMMAISTQAYAECPSRPQIGARLSLSGTVKSSDALAISIRSCRIIVMVDDANWPRKCAPGMKIQASGTYQETPLPFSPVPNIGDIQKLVCGKTKLR